MHKQNPHLNGYDMPALVRAIPELAKHVIKNPRGRETINFSDPISVKLLNQALLKHHYGVQVWDLPEGFLCPPIPGRMDYLLAVADLLDGLNISQKIRALDIGTGANLIYPILGAAHLGWSWVGSDVDPRSIKHANLIKDSNKNLKSEIQIRQQKHKHVIFDGMIQSDEYFDVTVCNPPFHKSAQDAAKGSARKSANLNRNKHKRGSTLQGNQALNFSGQSNELWCEGGEKAFVRNMIRESQQYAQQVGLFTCLVSKKENVKPLVDEVRKLNGQVSVHEMGQGNKISRFLAWSFN